MKNTILVSALLILDVILAGCPKPCIQADYAFAVNAPGCPKYII